MTPEQEKRLRKLLMLNPGEPAFVLLGRDLCAPEAIAMYVTIALRNGYAEKFTSSSYAALAKFRAYQERCPSLITKGVPDIPKWASDAIEKMTTGEGENPAIAISETHAFQATAVLLGIAEDELSDRIYEDSPRYDQKAAEALTKMQDAMRGALAEYLEKAIQPAVEAALWKYLEAQG